MKKIFALILAVVLALSLAACGEVAGNISSGINDSIHNDTTETNTQDDLQDISESSLETVTEDTSETPVHTHDYIATVTAPTCTEKGYTTYTCDCGDTYQSDETAATGHTYAEATCTEAATCHCGAASGSALGHNYEQGKCTRCKAADPDHAPADNDSQTVYITETGKRYHASQHCPGLSNAKVISESTLSAAKDKNLTPCARCH